MLKNSNWSFVMGIAGHETVVQSAICRPTFPTALPGECYYSVFLCRKLPDHSLHSNILINNNSTQGNTYQFNFNSDFLIRALTSSDESLSSFRYRFLISFFFFFCFIIIFVCDKLFTVMLRKFVITCFIYKINRSSSIAIYYSTNIIPTYFIQVL